MAATTANQALAQMLGTVKQLRWSSLPVARKRERLRKVLRENPLIQSGWLAKQLQCSAATVETLPRVYALDVQVALLEFQRMRKAQFCQRTVRWEVGVGFRQAWLRQVELAHLADSASE